MSDPQGSSGILGTDPLDSRVAAAPVAGRAPGSWWVRHRVGAGSTPVPGLLLVLGLALGPEGINLLSVDILSYLDPAVAAALATLGVLVGMRLDVRRGRELRLLGAASLESGVTLLLVLAGVLAVGVHDPSLLAAPLLPLLVATCAAASATSVAADLASPASTASRVADLDDALPIVVGGVALAVFRAGSAAGGGWLAVQCLLLVAAVAGAGLLLARSSGESGEHVFTAGVVLLLGGLAEFLGTSALFQGLAAGVLLAWLGGAARERIARGIRHVQHPLIVLLLLVAGASVTLKPAVFALVLAYVALRVTGKVAGGLLLRPMLQGQAAYVERSWISPGVIGAAFALDCGLAGADPTGLVLAATVTASVLSELLALVLRREEPL